MKQRIAMSIDKEVLDAVDSVRGLIPRSRFVTETLNQKIEQIREDGGVIGQI